MHIRTTALMSLVTLLCVSTAFAAPTKLSQQGRLLDDDSQGLTGSHALVFTLFDAETAGTEVWQEERVVSFEEGYYSVVLGEQVPLSDLLFAAGSVWLELSVDGGVLSPRQEIVSVPYALRAAVAEAVEGGPVDADEVAIGGNTVIDSSGNWVGPAVDWSELTGVPSDLSDGDADTDTLLGLPCGDGFIAKYSASLGAWDCAPDNDALGGLSCQAGEIPVYEATAALWVCGVDIDTDTNTQLTEAQVDAFVANNNYSTGAHTVDTNTQLTNAQVAAAALAEGFVTGAHTVDTNTQLTSAQVAAIATVEGFVTGAHTVDTDTQLTDAEVAAAALAEGFVTGTHTVDTDTQLTAAEVASAAIAQGFVTGPHTSDTNTDALAALSCADGEFPSYQASTSSWVCMNAVVLFDADGDGVLAWNDCNDSDPSDAPDHDCDGVLDANEGFTYSYVPAGPSTSAANGGPFPDSTYDGANGQLNDLLGGGWTETYGEPVWVGWALDNPQIVVTPTGGTITSVSVSVLGDRGSYIRLPEYVEIYSGSSGGSLLAQATWSAPYGIHPGGGWVKLNLPGPTAGPVRVVLKYSGFWTLISEIAVD